MWTRIAKLWMCRRRTRRRCGRRVQVVHWRTASSWWLLRWGGVRNFLIVIAAMASGGLLFVTVLGLVDGASTVARVSELVSDSAESDPIPPRLP